MELAEALKLPRLNRIRVVGGAGGLSRQVRWVHVVDIPDVRSWVRKGQLLLTTGYAWPRDGQALRNLIKDLDAHGLAGVGMAVPQFFDKFPRVAVETADELNFPLLEVPWEIPFATITEVVSREILAEQATILEQSEAIHRSLTKAAVEPDSLEELVRQISETLNRATLFFDPEGRLLARCASEVSGPIGEEKLESEELERQLLQARSPVQIDRGGSPWLIGPVRISQRLLGFIAVMKDGRRFTGLDLRAVEHAATIVALYFSHKQRLEIVQTRLHFGLVDSLIEGRWDDAPEAMERARLIGFDPEATYTVCVLLLHKESIPLDGEGAFMRREQVATKCRNFLTRGGGSDLITVSLNRVIALVPTDVDPHELWSLFDPEEVAIGVSEPRTGVQAIPYGFEQAVKALEWGSSFGFCRYDDLLLPRVLQGDRSAFPTFVARTLGPLQGEGRFRQTLSTLSALSRNDYSQTKTAEELFIHPNTLRYRIRRIEEFLAVDLSDPDTRFRIRLAIEILESSHKNSP